MYRRSRSCHTLSSRPWAERQNLVYGFSVALALRQVGTCAPLSPSPGLSQRAETALCLSAIIMYHNLQIFSRKKSCEPAWAPFTDFSQPQTSHFFAIHPSSLSPSSTKAPASFFCRSNRSRISRTILSGSVTLIFGPKDRSRISISISSCES